MSDAPSMPTLPVLDTAPGSPTAATNRVVREGTAGAPRQIGPYEITGVLGSGGMGVVYRAEQQEPLRREVALKLMRRGLDTERLIARFEAERLALARMSHSSIARVFDAGATDDGRPYFVMELVMGEPITEFCDAHRTPVRDRLALLVAACRAVQHAHQKGIIHRDLKPSNILVSTAEGPPSPKIIDFGIAKAVADDDDDHLLLTREGQLVGTPEYMSPEQAGVLDADVDTRSDVYALGVLLYELLAGRKPHRFTQGTRDEVQRVLRGEPPLRPSTVTLLAFSILTTVQAARVAQERDRAEQALARAGAVNRFLVGMFEQADPRQALGQTLTAEQMLERAAARLEKDLANEPAVRSELLQSLADVYKQLGRYDVSERLNTQAVALRRPGDPLVLATSLDSLGDVRRYAGRPDDAVAPLEEAQGRVQVARTRALLGNHAGASREADAILAAAAVNPDVPGAVLAEDDLVLASSALVDGRRADARALLTRARERIAGTSPARPPVTDLDRFAARLEGR